jgi:phosphoribosylanthranilate isomerase
MTRPQDALAAARHGADSIGMVFHPRSARNVTLERAKEILAVLPPFVTPVGLFVDQPGEAILETAITLGLKHLQLHGDESPDMLAELSRFTVLKAIPVLRDRFSATLAVWRKAVLSGRVPNLRGLILETGGTGQAGGTGVENDWNFIAERQRAGDFDDLPPIIAAGGLTPENVAQVIRTLRPYAVDVSSGVEGLTKGQKSEERIAEFVRQVSLANEA